MSRAFRVPPSLVTALCVGAAAVAAPRAAHALPIAFATKSGGAATASAGHVVIMRRGDASVVTVMADYDGPLEPFVVIIPVPSDVTTPRVRSLRAETVERVDQLTAPRFHEFWELDPCEPGKAEQEWERDLTVTGGGFLGGAAPPMGVAAGQVPKEMLLSTDPLFKDSSEYSFTVLEPSGDAAGWLSRKGYKAPEGLGAALAPYAQAGMKLLVAEVDHNKVGLAGGGRVQLSPIRFASTSPYTTLPARLGLTAMGKAQELFVYLLDPEKRWEVGNYANGTPPTDVEVDFTVKERMGEFYGALHDLYLKKHPGTFLTEWVWPSDACGQPCQNEAILLHELLTLGGDVFEETVPPAEKDPPTPDASEEEKKAIAELKPADRPKHEKAQKEARQALAKRRALISRQKYVLTRLHYRYGASDLPNDPTFKPADGHLRGGISLPKGKDREVKHGTEPGTEPRMQVRYNHFHPWKGMQQCDNPERWRWGKAPRDYRGLRKIWVADDIARKSRTQIVPAKVVLQAIPDLDLAAAPPKADDAAPAPSASAAAVTDAKGGCAVATTPPGSEASGFWAGAVLALTAALRRRRG